MLYLSCLFFLMKCSYCILFHSLFFFSFFWHTMIEWTQADVILCVCVCVTSVIGIVGLNNIKANDYCNVVLQVSNSFLFVLVVCLSVYFSLFPFTLLCLTPTPLTPLSHSPCPLVCIYSQCIIWKSVPAWQKGILPHNGTGWGTVLRWLWCSTATLHCTMKQLAFW